MEPLCVGSPPEASRNLGVVSTNQEVHDPNARANLEIEALHEPGGLAPHFVRSQCRLALTLPSPPYLFSVPRSLGSAGFSRACGTVSQGFQPATRVIL